MTSPKLHHHTAYRRGLCVDCQQVASAAAMPRCWPCHGKFAGTRLPLKQQHFAVVREMSGPRPSAEVFVLAWFIAAAMATVKRVLTP